MPETVSRTIQVQNRNGLHARTATDIAQTAQGFTCAVRLCLKAQEVDAKSILDILTLGAPQGAYIEVRAEGQDACKAVEKLGQVISNGND